MITWDEPKRRENLRKHGIDLALLEDVFDAPFRFDISRHPNRHLGFGTGEHFCLGAHVARMSSRKLLEEIANRVEVLEPAASPSQIESSFVVGLKSLPVRYRFRPATAA